MKSSVRSPILSRGIDMRTIALIFRREFAAYFATPLAAVFLAIFLALAAGMCFFVAGFFDRAQADLRSPMFG